MAVRELPTLEGASPEQEEILRDILLRLGGTTIERVALGPPPEDEDSDGWGLQPGDIAITVESRDSSVREQWKTWLLAAAFRDRSRERRLPAARVLGDQTATFNIDWRPGRRVEALGRGDRDAIEQRVDHAAAVTGALLDWIEVLAPYGVAVAATLAVVEPHAFLRHGWHAYVELSGHFDATRDGTYVEVVDGELEPVLRVGWVRGLGSGGTRRDLACCDPHPSSALEAPDPPPCPVRERTWDEALSAARSNLAGTTGRPLEHWLDLLADRHFDEMHEAVEAIAAEFGIGRLAAAAIAEKLVERY